MFPRPLQRSLTMDTDNKDSKAKKRFTITDRSYGKNGVKILHIKRDGPVHTIREFEIGPHIKLSTEKEYVDGENIDVVDSDALKNIIYILAKKHGINCPEEFALRVASFVLEQYSHVEEVHMHVEECPWKRVCQTRDDQTSDEHFSLIEKRQQHNHAFKSTPTERRYCDVVMRRTNPKQTVVSGIKELRLIKTTQASFYNFYQDEFRSTPDQHDRVFCAIVDCSWEYSHIDEVNFCQDWNAVSDIITNTIASKRLASTQRALYLTEEAILAALPQISIVSMTLLNMLYLHFDTEPFQSEVPGENNEVFVPVDKPHSIVYAQLARNE